ncbi:hypothetical protein [Streptomyces marincola]|uniref:Uncharacterized protein n=1 Tax=Streptomyces marincola TaxID=2878388 RepID=A0A1W7CXK1_9ACTN|nr:hypothetical protein [Streptomyces marincola]ARQ69466.1 hypothetical protein CAG99_11830 [Streptomyces marincola]
MTLSGKAEFDEVHINKGVRPVAQHGFVTVERGTLKLLGSDRKVIVSAPMSKVEASKARFTGGKTLAMKVDGTRYTVSPKWGDRAGKLMRPGRPEEVARASEQLLRLIEADGGTVERRDKDARANDLAARDGAARGSDA